MRNSLDWLPPLVYLEDCNGDWDSYLDAIYSFFKHDFVDDKPVFRGRRLGLKRHPQTHGKEATFWHMITEGKVEVERIPDLRRCERIRWPRPVIEHNDHPGIKCWVSVKKSDKRIHIWLDEVDYLVVLADRCDYLLPWTAFPVTWEHTRAKLLKEYEAYRRDMAKNS